MASSVWVPAAPSALVAILLQLELVGEEQVVIWRDARLLVLGCCVFAKLVGCG